jgi:histidine triad (HIT) family protein
MKTDPNCIFCKIVVGQMPCSKLLEDDDTLAFMISIRLMTGIVSL